MRKPCVKAGRRYGPTALDNEAFAGDFRPILKGAVIRVAVRTFTTGAGGVRSWWTPWVFLAPYLVLTCVFFIYPFFNAIWLAFHQTNGPTRAVFVGLDNFRFVLSDPDFRTAVWNTTIASGVSIGALVRIGVSDGVSRTYDRTGEPFFSEP